MITQPQNETRQTSLGKMLVKFSGGLASSVNQGLRKRQKIIDSEVIRLCAPLMPKKTGAMIASAESKDGEVDYTAKYARVQYYNTKQTRSYDSNRGGRWFERMKLANKREILDKAQKG